MSEEVALALTRCLGSQLDHMVEATWSHRTEKKYYGADVLILRLHQVKIVKSLFAPSFYPALHCFADSFAKVMEAICYCLEINDLL